MRVLKFLPAFLLVLQSAPALFAQDSFFNDLRTATPDAFTLICQWDSLFTATDDSDRDGQAVIVRSDTTETWEAKFALRGRYRRMNCAFPPLELNLKKSELRQHGLNEFDKIKIVTHCKVGEPRPEDLFEELLVYELYNLISPHSFRAILIGLDYQYPNGKYEQRKASALMIEPTAELADRLGGQELEGFGIASDSLDPAGYCRQAMYQFMVGNADWDQTIQRNVKTIGAGGKYFIIPYDFDFSAIVMPSYGMLSREYGQKDFRDRVFLGKYFFEEIPAIRNEFLSKKGQVLTYVTNFPHLSKTRKKEIVSYLETFFDFIASESPIVYKTLIPYKG